MQSGGKKTFVSDNIVLRGCCVILFAIISITCTTLKRIRWKEAGEWKCACWSLGLITINTTSLLFPMTTACHKREVPLVCLFSRSLPLSLWVCKVFFLTSLRWVLWVRGGIWASACVVWVIQSNNVPVALSGILSQWDTLCCCCNVFDASTLRFGQANVRMMKTD